MILLLSESNWLGLYDRNLIVPELHKVSYDSGTTSVTLPQFSVYHSHSEGGIIFQSCPFVCLSVNMITPVYRERYHHDFFQGIIIWLKGRTSSKNGYI